MIPTRPIADPSVVDIKVLSAALSSNLALGLTTQEAALRLAKIGPNQLRATRTISTWQRILVHFQDPLIYLLLVACTIALLAWAAEDYAGWPVDAIVIGAVVVLNALLGYAQEAKARNAVAALSQLTAATSKVIRDGRLTSVVTDTLVPGDLLVLGEGDAVGADARLVEARALLVQEASLTGESEAVLKDASTLSKPVALGDRLNMVFKGTAVAQGNARALITATGMHTELGSIAALLDATTEEPTPLQKEVAYLGRMLSLAIVIIAGIVVSTILIMSKPGDAAAIIEVLLLGVALAVAAVPEGLPAILSLVLALGVQRMAKHNAIVKNLASVATLGSTSVICSDKTGTLTRGEMTIEQVITASGSTVITDHGYVQHGTVEHSRTDLTDEPLMQEQIVVLCGGSLAGNAALHTDTGGKWQTQGDPTEAAFLIAEHKLGLTTRRERRFTRLGEIPFTSERKMMSALAVDHEHDEAVVMITKGAPDILLERCTRLRVGSNVVALDDSRRAQILANVDALSDAAFRTLAVAYRPLEPDETHNVSHTLENNLIFAGTVGMMDPPRAQAAAAIEEARHAGIRVIMITGDHPRTASRIAIDLGIAETANQVLTGLQLDALDHTNFPDTVRRTAVYARVAPAHKLRIVDALQAQGNIVAMTGDGVNDAPALKAADIGIAMGITGTEVTKAAAKMVLADDNFATIVQAVREGRSIFDNIRKFLRYLLSSNMGEVLTVFLGVVGARFIGLTDSEGNLQMPLLATQILWINLVTDSGPALAMGIDPANEDVMSRPPRALTERIIDTHMWVRVTEIGLVVAATTLLTFDLFLPGGLIAGTQDLATARTAGFTVLVFISLFNCFNARSDTVSAFHHLFVNPWLWTAIVLSTLLQIAVVNSPFLNLAFSTVPLTLHQWFTCVVLSSAVLWYSELRKLGRWLWQYGSQRPDITANHDPPERSEWTSNSGVTTVSPAPVDPDTAVERKTPCPIKAYVGLSIATLSLYLCYQLDFALLPPLTWALVLAILFTPLQEWFEAKRYKSALAALASVLIIGMTVIVPATYVGQRLIEQVTQGTEVIISQVYSGEWRSTMASYPALASMPDRIEHEIDLSRYVEPLARWSSKARASFGQHALLPNVELSLTLLFLFFMLRDREATLALLRSVLPLRDAEADELMHRVSDTINVTLYALFALPSIQGLLGGLMYWWLGLATPMLWSMVMALLALIPVPGAVLLWLPAALLLAMKGYWVKALTLMLWGIFVIGTADKLLRPFLLGNHRKLPSFLAVISAIGGFICLGSTGLILAPLIVTITTVLLTGYRHRLPEPGH